MTTQSAAYSANIFLDAEGVQKFLDGVITTQAQKLSTQNFLQKQLGDAGFTESDTVNFDVEKSRKNIQGQYAHPQAQTRGIELPTFNHRQFGFTYSKESIGQIGYEQARQRKIGSLEINVMDNILTDMREKTAIALNCFTNLRELGIRDILFTGQHTAVSEYHPAVVYDFGRTNINAIADVGAVKGLTSSLKSHTAYNVDLKTIGGTTAGMMPWGASGGTLTTGATPYKNIVSAAKAQRRKLGQHGICIISEDAYDLLEQDIKTNYAEAGKTTTMAMANIEMKILPEAAKFEGLEFRRMLPLLGGDGANGVGLPIYTYNAWYNERKTGTLKNLIPNGYFVLIPPPQHGMIRYGKIMHLKAQYQSMQYWINTAYDEWNGNTKSEIHSSWVQGYPDMDAVCCWKVLTDSTDAASF
jgi:hypothetical protein